MKMKRRAFTLIELLVVMAIIGLMGTVSVGGYRAMQRGIEERGVMESVNSFLRAAYQRAQIDRQPTVVYFWNETLRSSTEEDNEIVVGKAVAVRRAGRLTDVRNGLLVDEFGDLDQTYTVANGGMGGESAFYLYPMDNPSSSMKRSLVEGDVFEVPDGVLFYSGDKNDTTSDQQIPAYGFRVKDQNDVTWRPGMSYGTDFINLELPHGYIFGDDYSTSAATPIRSAGVIVYRVRKIDGSGAGGLSGADSIRVCSLRTNQGSMKAETVASSDDPGGMLK